MKHTELPWISMGTRVYFPGTRGGFDIRECPDAEANAAFIVRAVNCHEQLVKAMAGLLWHMGEEKQTSPWVLSARAALAAAKGEE